MAKIGRKKPRSAAEMAKQKCVGCRKPAVHQWSCCANDNLWMPVCLDCDFALNEVALAVLKIPNREVMMRRYRQRELRKALKR